MRTLGVTVIDPWFVLADESLRKDLIYFDKVVYHIDNLEMLEKFCYTLPRGKEKFMRTMAEIESLEIANLVIEYSESNIGFNIQKLADQQALDLTARCLKLASGFSTKDKPVKNAFTDFLETFSDVAQLEARVKSGYLNKGSGDRHIPILRRKFHKLSDDQTFLESNVLAVLFKKFPMIKSSADIDRFIEFKNDSDSNLRLSRLRDWVLEISKKDYHVKEIEQKLDYLLCEYAAQLKLHRLQYSYGAFETLIMASLEAIENLVKLNLSKAAKVVFDLKKEKINLLREEHEMTGKEVGFIHHINEDSRIFG